MNGKKKKLIIFSAAICIALAVLVFASIRSAKSINNSFIPSGADIVVIENGEPTDAVMNTVVFDDEVVGENKTGNVVAAKLVQIKNTGGTNPVPVYVRVCIFPKFVNESESAFQVGILQDDFPASITGSYFTMGDVTFNLADNWDSHWSYNNGYFYYTTPHYADTDDGGITDKGVLYVGDTTEPLLKSVTVKKETLLKNYSDNGALLRVSVLADAVQTVGGAVEQRWNTDMLASNDVPRPIDTVATTAAFAAFAEDDTTSDSVFADYVMTQYEQARINKMISSITVTVVYQLPQEDTEEEVFCDEQQPDNGQQYEEKSNTEEAVLGDESVIDEPQTEQ